jgi:hypothetical protein
MNLTSLHPSSIDRLGESTDEKYAISNWRASISTSSTVPTFRAARLGITTSTALLLFLFCALSSTCSAADSVGGPIRKGDCFLAHVKWDASLGKILNHTPANTENSILSKSPSLSDNFALKSSEFYSWRGNYQLRTFRLTPGGPQVPFFPAHYEPRPSFDWRCKRYIFGSGSL